MLDDLVKCIETLKFRMESHAASLQANEWRTRTQLIDPLLCVLGWDVSDPELVTPEHNVGPKRVDLCVAAARRRNRCCYGSQSIKYDILRREPGADDKLFDQRGH